MFQKFLERKLVWQAAVTSLFAAVMFGVVTTVVFAQAGGGQIQNPIEADSLGALIVRVVNFLLVMVGGLSVLFIIIGAVRMVSSGGNEQSVAAGKKTITWAIIGLVVALMAFSIIALLQNVLGRK